MQKNKDNTHPCVSTPSCVSSAVLVCQRKVVTGKTVFSALLTLAGNTLRLWTSIQSSCTAAVRVKSCSVITCLLQGRYLWHIQAPSVQLTVLSRRLEKIRIPKMKDCTQAFCEFDWLGFSGMLYASLSMLSLVLTLCVCTFFPILLSTRS